MEGNVATFIFAVDDSKYMVPKPVTIGPVQFTVAEVKFNLLKLFPKLIAPVFGKLITPVFTVTVTPAAILITPAFTDAPELTSQFVV